MPVYYFDEVANVKKTCQTCSLLFRWQGSIYKLLWRPVLMYFVSYVALGLIYKFGLDEDSKRTFEKIALYSAKYADSIPVVLMLGFFTGTVMQRWWAVYAAIPGTGKIITLATFYMKKDHENASKWLRTLVRYVVVSWLLCMRNVCQPLREKYPTLKSMQQAGLLLHHEVEILVELEARDGISKLSLYPINWALLLVREGRDMGVFDSPSDATRILDPLVAFKKSCSTVLKFQITAIPLSFIQAVTLTVHSFGIVSLMGRQFVDFPTKLLVIDCYLPILPAMQYLAYLSWLKLAEVAVNPFGDDDDDFDVIGLFDNHLETCRDLLSIFETGKKSPTKESLEKTGLTLFKTPNQYGNEKDKDNNILKKIQDFPFADAEEELEVMIKK